MLTKMISVSEGQNLLTPKADLVIPLSALPWDLSQFQFLQMQIEWRRKRKEGGGNEQAPNGRARAELTSVKFMASDSRFLPSRFVGL